MSSEVLLVEKKATQDQEGWRNPFFSVWNFFKGFFVEQVQVLPFDPQDLKVLLFGEKGTLLAICWQESKLLASLLPTCAFCEVPVDLQFLFRKLSGEL